MSSQRDIYERLRERIAAFPVIDCHEHAEGPGNANTVQEPIARLTDWYFYHDLMSVVYPGWQSAGHDLTPEALLTLLKSPTVSTEEKWPLFEPIWRQTEHTGYARVTKRMLAADYGEPAMSLDALLHVRDNMLNLHDPAVYGVVLDRAHIVCRLVNIWIDLKAYVAGTRTIYERDRFMIPLPDFHDVRNWEAVCRNTGIIGQYVTNLDDYVAVCREIFYRMQTRGAAGMKDQSAYTRDLAFGNPTRAEAEALFNRMAANPRASLGWPEAQPLDDYLFHCFMNMAAELEMPVQLHTGHMAGIRNDIAKTNAVHLIPMLELHRDVRFDLFHGNWPYMGEYLYLGKNYPNVHLDLCWLHMVDPVYSRNLLSEGLTALPHGKIHAFGGDCGDDVLLGVRHLDLALDDVAAALAERVDAGWLDEPAALQVAADWLFNNPNEFFKLGFECFQP
jgi:uncharacterized protein